MVSSRCRAFRFQLRPTTKQTRALERLLAGQRELYNAALEERRGAWRWNRRAVTRFEQYRTLSGLREVRPDTLAFGVTVCRGTLNRLDLAFRAFFRRVRAGQAPGFPRFQGQHRFDSLSWPDRSGWKLDEVGHRLYLQGIGQVKYRKNLPRRGNPKTITVRREGRRWFVTVFCADVPAQPRPATGRRIGIDAGVNALVATSDGDTVDNPRWVRRGADRLRVAQRALTSKQKGSARRRRAVEAVGRAHRKVQNQRRDHAHWLSRRLVDANDVIVHEDLCIANLVRRPKPRPGDDGSYEPNGAAAKAGLNREILSAGWGQLLRFISYKAEEAGRTVIAVDPRHTSQTCHSCGFVDAGNRTGTAFCCRRCGHTDHADINAAKNILRAGLARREQSRIANRAVA
jgi:putative transposase